MFGAASPGGNVGGSGVASSPPAIERIRVLFVAPALRMGGMERHAVTLLPALDQTRFEVMAVCLEERGSLFDELVAAGIPARAFHGHGSKVGMSVAFLRLMGTAYRFEPDLISWPTSAGATG